MGELRYFMGELRKITGGQLRVVNYGRLRTKNLAFFYNYGRLWVITVHYGITANYASKPIKHHLGFKNHLKMKEKSVEKSQPATVIQLKAS